MGALHDELAGEHGRPVVVMAHGVGGTVDTGLRQFAESLCATGVDVLAFDYRGFGTSGGTPRQSVSMHGQVVDFHAAVDAARGLSGVDPDRVVLWGVSLAGGHVLAVAAARRDVAAVIALTPLVDGWAAAVLALRHCSPMSVARCTAAGVRSRASVARGVTRSPSPSWRRPGMTVRSTSAVHSIATPRWQARRGRTGSMRPSGSSYSDIDPPARPPASAAPYWSRSVTLIAARHRMQR